MTARIERQRLGKEDRHPEIQDGHPGRKTGVREAKKTAVQLKIGASSQNSRPDRENKRGDEKTGGVQLRSRLGKQMKS
jgi:hypothetical protein